MALEKTRWHFITIGGATRDLMFYPKEGKILKNPKLDPTIQKFLCFEYGAKIEISKPYETFGGGGANSAVCLAKLGFRVTPLLRIGKDKGGDLILENLIRNRIETRLVQRDKTHNSGVSFILNFGPKRERTIFTYRGANNFLIFPKLKEIQRSWFYITSLPQNNWRKILLEVRKRVLDSKEVKLAWNPGMAQISQGKNIFKEFFNCTNLFILNKDEAIELVISDKIHRRKSIQFLNKIENLLRIIKSWGPGIVLITNGPKGAWATEGEKIYFVPAFSSKQRVVDRTGVGDTFGSTFLAGLIIYKEIGKALKLAALNAASVTTKIGAQEGLLSLKELERILDKIKNKIKIKLLNYG